MVTVEMYGDSTTNGEGYYIDAKYGANVVVTCKGVSGTTLKDLIKGENGQIKFSTALAASDADIVTLNFGINDAFQGYQSFTWYLGEAKRLATLYNKTILFQTSNPVNTPYFQATSDLANQIRTWAIATNTKYADNYISILNTPNWQSMLVDGVHPNQQLYELKAGYTYYVLNPLVQWYLDN